MHFILYYNITGSLISFHRWCFWLWRKMLGRAKREDLGWIRSEEDRNLLASSLSLLLIDSRPNDMQISQVANLNMKHTKKIQRFRCTFPDGWNWNSTIKMHELCCTILNRFAACDFFAYFFASTFSGFSLEYIIAY